MSKNEPIFSTLTGKTTGYVVSGAGTAAANGTYCPSGNIDGGTIYSNGAYVLFIKEQCGFWQINTTTDTTCGSDFYYGGADPLTQWYVGNGDAPAPTVTSTTCS
jgi:hypothetical protein